MGLDELLAPLLAAPAAAGICCDFDGTLSPIVDDPAAARFQPGTRDALGALVGRYALVAVVSGRPVDFLVDLVPDGVVVSGLYGLEAAVDGERRDLAGAGAWREAIEHVAASARASGPEGMLVEPKGLSLTLHYRTRPDIEDEVLAWAGRAGIRAGLHVRPARMSVELHPPIASDKGTAVRALADGLGAVLYIGDDVGDLPAFAALDGLAADGVATVKVAVRSDEVAPEFLAAADHVVDGPPGALALLRALSRPG